MIFDGHAGGHHLVNVLLHGCNVCLLFFILRQATGKMWESAAVAFLFAVHPLNVESVAWISERKNLLSTSFWFASMAAYVQYTKKRNVKTYSALLVYFILGLMAKPMLVTLPAVFLLMDFWPLDRFVMNKALPREDENEFSRLRPMQLVTEKIPLLIISLLSVLITLYAARGGGAIRSLELFPMAERLSNALVSYTSYIVKMFWPVRLSIFYPYQFSIQKGMAVISGVTLAILSIVAWKRRYGKPYLLFGWFWYLITLVPVIGIVQVGYQSMADRYAYIPMIGLLVLMVWGLTDVFSYLHMPRAVVAAAATLLILVLAIVSFTQLRYWQNSENVFSHALAVTGRNHIAHVGLGNVYLKKNDMMKAEYHYRQSISIRPDDPVALNNLGVIASHRGALQDAIRYYREAIRYDPNFAKAYYNLGITFECQGNWSKAIEQFRIALRMNPDANSVKVALDDAEQYQGKSSGP
jgi:tetratricopeptide (TPR) repeat protein